MAGLDPAIHVLGRQKSKTWITGTSPVMTKTGKTPRSRGAD